MGFFYLLIGLGILLLLLAAGRWFANASARHVAAGLRWAAIGGGGLAALWLLATGRAVQTLYLLLPLLPVLRRWWQRHGAAVPPAAGQGSDVETAWLRMHLDHETGAMDGLVLAGGFKGRKLGELAPAQLLDLLAELRIADGDSAALLETYLDALHPAWRQAGEAGSASPGAEPGAGGGARARAMDRDEAARILGVAPDASREEIIRAWRELMKRNHPDQGGSAYLAARINEAKDTLLG
jgi:hypothetical protein